MTQIRLSAERYLGGALSSVDFGVQFDSRTKSRNASNQGFLGLRSGELSADFSPTGVVNVPFGLPAIAIFDPQALFASGIYYRADHFGGGVLANDWTVDEDVQLAYVKFNINSELGDIPVTGNFGLQVVRTDQSSSGKSAAPGGWPPPSSAAEATTFANRFRRRYLHGLFAESESEFRDCGWPIHPLGYCPARWPEREWTKCAPVAK